jgi:hypothetical protein
MVILIAIAAGQITTTHWNQVGEHRMTGGDQRAADKAELPNFLLNEFSFTHYETENPGPGSERIMKPKNSDRALQTQPVTRAVANEKGP